MGRESTSCSSRLGSDAPLKLEGLYSVAFQHLMPKFMANHCIPKTSSQMRPISMQLDTKFSEILQKYITYQLNHIEKIWLAEAPAPPLNPRTDEISVVEPTIGRPGSLLRLANPRRERQEEERCTRTQGLGPAF